MKVYIVWYSTGEYEDRIRYPYKIFDSIEKAETCAKVRNDFLIENKVYISNKENNYITYEDREHAKEMFLERFGEEEIKIDYTGGKFSEGRQGIEVE